MLYEGVPGFVDALSGDQDILDGDAMKDLREQFGGAKDGLSGCHRLGHCEYRCIF